MQVIPQVHLFQLYYVGTAFGILQYLTTIAFLA